MAALLEYFRVVDFFEFLAIFPMGHIDLVINSSSCSSSGSSGSGSSSRNFNDSG